MSAERQCNKARSTFLSRCLLPYPGVARDRLRSVSVFSTLKRTSNAGMLRQETEVDGDQPVASVMHLLESKVSEQDTVTYENFTFHQSLSMFHAHHADDGSDKY